MDTNNYDKQYEKGIFGISVSYFAQKNWVSNCKPI